MIPRVHVETLPHTAEDRAARPAVPATVAWAVVVLMIALTLLGSTVGAAMSFGANASAFLLVLGGMLLVLAAVALVPRLLRARR